MRRLIVAAVGAVGMVAAGMAQAEEFTPALVFDVGGKLDKSYNEAAYRGAERYKAESGIGYLEFEITGPAMREEALREMVRRGAHAVVAVGLLPRAQRLRSLPRSSRTSNSRSSTGWWSCQMCGAWYSRSMRARFSWGWRRRWRRGVAK